MQNKELDGLVERAKISALLTGWGYWRDTCNWARLADCYTADAHMLTTWFDGTACAFLEASQRMAAKGSNLQHYIGTPIIDIHQDRATAATRIQLLVRGEIEGVAVDATCYGRFHDRLVKQNGTWRIQRRVPVYEKDTLCVVHPEDELTLDVERLQTFPAHYRFLAYLQSLGGATISPDLPAPNSPAEHQLFKEDDAWLSSSQSPTKADKS
ncbi:nuclear transport factor 2 family protein [Polaromonas glacialis]|uniref:nuclear transport factor 2 family protein n=1 Tax=Polaromonas glacialis TaxID=866564 RepID=UPI0004955C4D|nr:nuclear transport factor 2 family protein [Polaromonas glacialis]